MDRSGEPSARSAATACWIPALSCATEVIRAAGGVRRAVHALGGGHAGGGHSGREDHSCQRGRSGGTPARSHDALRWVRPRRTPRRSLVLNGHQNDRSESSLGRQPVPGGSGSGTPDAVPAPRRPGGAPVPPGGRIPSLPPGARRGPRRRARRSPRGGCIDCRPRGAKDALSQICVIRTRRRDLPGHEEHTQSGFGEGRRHGARRSGG
jgi:hypothetical protein